MSREKSILTIVLIAWVSLLTIFPLVSNDLWWHLATGRLILSEGFPQIDPFSFASSHLQWINHAWFFDLSIFGWQQSFGETGLIAFRLIVTLFLALALFMHRVKKGEYGMTAICWVVFLLAAARHRLMVRPELIGLLIFGLFLILWDRRRPGRVLLTSLLFLLWVNVHASILLGLIVLILLLACEAITDKRPAILLWFLPIASITLVNPFGYKAIIAPISLMGKLVSLPVVNPEWAPPPLPLFVPLFLAFAIALLISMGSESKFSLYRQPLKGLILLGTFLMAISSIRHAGFFVVAAAVLVPPIHSKRLSPLFLAIAVLSTGWVLMVHQSPGLGIDRYKFPSETVSHMQEHPPCGNIYNHPGMGGYLAWELYPDRKIFIDGRNELYVPLLRSVNQAMGELTLWNDLLDHFSIRHSILPYQGEVTVLQGEEQVIMPASWSRFPPDRWALVEYDDAALLFYARVPCNAKLLLNEYRFNPESPAFAVKQLEEGVWKYDEVVGELERKIASDPDCKRARSLLERVRRAR